MPEDIIKNKYGFYELLNKPSTQELDIYYSEKYYQDSKSSTYEHKYSNQEIQYKFNKIFQKNLLIKEIIGSESGLFLDVGSGEGFALKYFGDLGWSCTGLDYSLFGIKTHNPDQKNSVIAGDIFKNLSEIIKPNEDLKELIKKYDHGLEYGIHIRRGACSKDSENVGCHGKDENGEIKKAFFAKDTALEKFIEVVEKTDEKLVRKCSTCRLTIEDDPKTAEYPR